MLLTLAQELDARHAGHAVVGDDHRHVLRGEDLERRRAALGAQHAELGGEDGFERIEDARLVVDDEDGRLVQRGTSYPSTS